RPSGKFSSRPCAWSTEELALTRSPKTALSEATAASGDSMSFLPWLLLSVRRGEGERCLDRRLRVGRNDLHIYLPVPAHRQIRLRAVLTRHIVRCLKLDALRAHIHVEGGLRDDHHRAVHRLILGIGHRHNEVVSAKARGRHLQGYGGGPRRRGLATDRAG